MSCRHATARSRCTRFWSRVEVICSTFNLLRLHFAAKQYGLTADNSIYSTNFTVQFTRPSLCELIRPLRLQAAGFTGLLHLQFLSSQL
jgi:hypothetical protein